IVHPIGQTELATVTDNNDPDKLSRVKVKFHWSGSDNDSQWIRVGHFYTGGDDRKGMQFIPEKEAQVMVGYEMNKPEYPFVMTSLYPKKDSMRSRKGNNDEKTIFTKAGNLIEFIDKQGENQIRITNVNKDDTAILIEFKEQGGITVKTNGQVKIEAKKDITISADQKLTLGASDIEISAQNKTTIKGKEIKIEADLNAEMKGNVGVKVSSTNTEVSGDAMTTIKGGIVKIN
ncbi:MAG TPA: phage baseplate assembly protein V, partial [Puia sp.]|nr:phage baseplate assembly protein V [Puia sp.]